MPLLASKCNEGGLAEGERAEYEGYVRANNFVATLQAEARRLLAAKKPSFRLRPSFKWWYNIDMTHAKLNQLAVELIADPTEGGYTARVPDIPAYGEGETEDAAIADLKEALRGYIETFGLDDAMQRLNAPIAIRFIDMDLADLGRA